MEVTTLERRLDLIERELSDEARELALLQDMNSVLRRTLESTRGELDQAIEEFLTRREENIGEGRTRCVTFDDKARHREYHVGEIDGFSGTESSFGGLCGRSAIHTRSCIMGGVAQIYRGDMLSGQKEDEGGQSIFVDNINMLLSFPSGTRRISIRFGELGW